MKKEKKGVIRAQENNLLRVPQVLFFLLLVAWGIVVFSNYMKHYDYVDTIVLSRVMEFQGNTGNLFAVALKHLYRILLACLIPLSGLGYGMLLIKRTGYFKGINRLEEFLFGTGLGLGMIMVFILVTGMLGLIYKSVIITIVTAGGVLGIYAVYEIITEKIMLKVEKEKFSLLQLLFLAVIALCFIAVLPITLSPPIFYDALVYHLKLPQDWLINHRVAPEAFMNVSYFPLHLHLLFMICLTIGDGIVAKILHYLLSVLAMISVYSFSRRFFDKRTGIMACLIYSSIPLVLMVTAKSVTEMGLAFFEVLAIYALMLWYNSEDRKIQWFMLSAFFCGIEVGAKYTGLFALLGMTLLIIVYLLKEKAGIKKLARILFIFWLVAWLTGGLWYARNLIQFKNPVYPMLFTKIGEQGNLMDKSEDAVTPGEHKSKKLSLETLVIPWNTTMGKYEEGYSGLILLILLPIGFLLKKQDKTVKMLLVFLIPYILMWATIGSAYFRYIIPCLSICCIILASYVVRMELNNLLKSIVFFMLIYLSVVNVTHYVIIHYGNANPLGVFLGAQSEDDYLSNQRGTYPCPYYNTIRWSNQNLPKGSRILFVCESRGFYSKHDVVSRTVQDVSPLVLWTKHSKDAKDLYIKLKEEGITHIMLNVPEGMRLKGYNVFDWYDKEKAVFSEFWNRYIKKLFESDMVFIYEIMKSEDACKPHVPPENYIAYLYGSE